MPPVQPQATNLLLQLDQMLNLPHSRPSQATSENEAHPHGSKASKRHHRFQRITSTRAGSVAVTAAASYAAIRLSIAIFHASRRHFLRHLLRDVSAALTALGVTHWLDFGALLGIYRDGDLIPHDNDTDFVVVNPDWADLLPKLKTAMGPRYSVKIVTPKDDPDNKWIRVYCPLGMADLFGATHNKEEEVVEVSCGHGDHMHIPQRLVLPPSSLHWRGVTFASPADVEGTLRHRYGDEWHINKYMAKGADKVENEKPYAKLFRLLARIGIKI